VSGIDDTLMSKLSSDTLNLPLDEFIFSRLSSAKKFVRVAAQYLL